MRARLVNPHVIVDRFGVFLRVFVENWRICNSDLVLLFFWKVVLLPPKADYSYLDILPRGQLERRLDAAVDNYCALLESGADVDAEKMKKATQLIKGLKKGSRKR